jgi:hypothetical protein
MTLWLRNPEYNKTSAIFIWSLVIWLLAIWGSWGIRRYENPILAALPAGVVLGGALAYVGGDAKVLILLVGCVLLLLSLTSHHLRERRWEGILLTFLRRAALRCERLVGFHHAELDAGCIDAPESLHSKRNFLD